MGRVRAIAVMVALVALAASGCAAKSTTIGAGSLAAQVRAAKPASITSLTGPIVALGDSYTSGDLLPLRRGSAPFGCYQSTSAYPAAVAKGLHDSAGLIDAACSGATTANITSAEHTKAGTNPPQLSFVTSSDKLVMLTLSGNDLGFTDVLSKCGKLSWHNPFGSPCKDKYTSGGTDQLAALVAKESRKMTAVLRAIHAKAPHARVVLVSYPDLFPQHGSCWPVVPITTGDIGYLRGIEVKLNAVLASAAKATSTQFVDTYTPTIGHDFCSDGKVRYVEGLIPGSLTAPFHANAKGHAAIAKIVLAALRAR